MLRAVAISERKPENIMDDCPAKHTTQNIYARSLLWGCMGLGLLALVIVPVRAATEHFFLQWEEPGPSRPWLDQVSIRVFSGAATLTSRPLPAITGEYAHGLEVALTMDENDGAPAWLQVRLADGGG